MSTEASRALTILSSTAACVRACRAPCYIGGNHSPTMKNHSAAGEKFQKLVELMAQLRAPGGCPWDREQTFDSIKPYTLDETYEIFDAICRRFWDGRTEYLCDFLLQGVF